jgi:hypothetical protein
MPPRHRLVCNGVARINGHLEPDRRTGSRSAAIRAIAVGLRPAVSLLNMATGSITARNITDQPAILVVGA